MEREGIGRHLKEPGGIGEHNNKVNEFVPCGGVVQLVRTPACHAGGRGFESRRSRQFFEAAPYLVSTRHHFDLFRVLPVIHPQSLTKLPTSRLPITNPASRRGR